MRTILTDTYHGWDIHVSTEKNMCSNYSFDITDPLGNTQHVSLGGDDQRRALNRAKELIDLEIAMSRYTES